MNNSLGESIDPRTKIFILFIGNISVFLAPSVSYEIIIAVIIALYGLFNKVYSYTIRMFIIYILIILLQLYGSYYFSGALWLMIVTFLLLLRKVLPCVILAGVLIKTTRINEFMCAMYRLKLSKNIVIPLAVMLRYFPMIKEDWQAIRHAMKMRQIFLSPKSFITKPKQTIECLYVPLLLAAAKIADELSAATITRGIENPNSRTSLYELNYNLLDYFSIAMFLCLGMGTLIF